MKKTIFTILFVLSVTINCMAQMTYKDGKLTVGRGMYKTYTTSWAGWAHYWGVHGPERYQNAHSCSRSPYVYYNQ